MNRWEKLLYSLINHYNPDYYWKTRSRLVTRQDHTWVLKKMIWLYRLKKMEASNNASLGTYLNRGSSFESRPILPHGLRGIHVSEKAHLGKNVLIYQNCTIGVLRSSEGAPTIGDNCILGAGCAVLGEIKIGNNVNIGANCVVNFDVPDNCTVVAQKARVIVRDASKK